MQNKNIMVVIDELGYLLDKYKDDIKFKQIEIDNLKRKIEQIEQYANFYSEDTVTKGDYKEAIK